MLLSNIVAEFITLLFPGMEVHGRYPFRVTRNSDLFVDEEEVDDLRRALEGELAHRRYGACRAARDLGGLPGGSWPTSCWSSSG